jgi:hypothetical protein
MSCMEGTGIGALVGQRRMQQHRRGPTPLRRPTSQNPRVIFCDLWQEDDMCDANRSERGVCNGLLLATFPFRNTTGKWFNIKMR